MYPPNSLGFHDVRGNVWQWTEDHVTALIIPFPTSYLYHDYSTPFFDGRHNVIIVSEPIKFAIAISLSINLSITVLTIAGCIRARSCFDLATLD